eukprot:m.31849 g.31849  ORF g.31849 m.31849 type:complete len:409 (-) comp14853_c0_seq2:123-1349(-)
MANYQTLELTINKKQRGVGFQILGGNNTPRGQEGNPGIYVSQIVSQAVASEAGLRVGDHILTINGVDVTNVSYQDALTALMNTPEVFSLKVERDLNETNNVEDLPATTDVKSSDEAKHATVVVSEEPANTATTLAPSGNRVDAARKSYHQGDPEMSKFVHDNIAAAERHQTGAGDYIKAAVFGGLDGIITTFAVVASVNGADLSTGVVVVMGFANLFADGLSMGFGEFLSEQSEQQYTVSERRREEWEFDNYPEGEISEMIDLYVDKGFNEEEASSIIHMMSKHKEFFIDHMMVQELGLMPPETEGSALKKGGVMFLAFVIFGLVPLLSYVALGSIDWGDSFDPLFLIACLLTAVALFVLGAIKSKFSTQSWYVSGSWVLMNGVLAAGIAYLVGFVLQVLSFSTHLKS